MQTLKEYRTKQGLSQADFGALVGASQGMISRLESGKGYPSLTLALQIEEKTDGMVLAKSFAPDLVAAR
ncbi:MAG: helix-turn-helix transcriptional regulator [Pseudomonadota bacterium]